MNAFLALGILVAVTAAIRGIWSPCGLSMLSSITPMTEAGRNNRFSVTATWFVVGAVIGGLSLGAAASLGAAGLELAGLTLAQRAGLGAAIAVVTAGIDLGVFGIELPIFKRQVNDAWLRNYRSWVYGSGFGWQIGFGLATYIMTAGVLLTVALAVLTVSVAQALAIGVAFGVVRGSAVWLGRGATSPDALRAIHARLDRWSTGSRLLALSSQVVAAVVLAGLAGGFVVAALVAAAIAVAAVAQARGREARTAHA